MHPHLQASPRREWDMQMRKRLQASPRREWDMQTLTHLHISQKERLCKQKLFSFFPSSQIQKLCTIKSILRSELHFRLCFGKADVSEKFRLEPSREFLRECVPQIAFFRTFFSKKKVHKGAGFAGDFRIDDTCSACFANSFRYFLAKMPAFPSRRSLQGCSAPLAYPPKREAKNSCAPPVPAGTKVPHKP